MPTQWYYRINGDNVGPVSSQVLKQLAATGTVTQDTPIRKEGRDKWVAARLVKGLLPESSVPASQAPPAQQQGEQAPPPAQKASDTEQWLWLTEAGEQPPKPLSCLHKMFLEGQLKPTDCLQPYDPLREEGVTNPIPAGDLFDEDSAVIPDGRKSWTVVSDGTARAPCSIKRIERLYNNGDMSDEDTVTRTGCRTLALAQLFDPDEAARLPCTLPLRRQSADVQAIVSGVVGLLIGLVCGVVKGGLVTHCVKGFVIGSGFDYLSARGESGVRLATAPMPVVLLLALMIGVVEPTVSAIAGRSLSMLGNPLGLGGGPKLAALRKVVAKYKQSPGRFASDKQRERYNRELQVIQNAFSEIPFDVSTNRKEAEAIVRMWESELEGAHTGELYRELEILISSIYMDIRRSE